MVDKKRLILLVKAHFASDPEIKEIKQYEFKLDESTVRCDSPPDDCMELISPDKTRGYTFFGQQFCKRDRGFVLDWLVKPHALASKREVLTTILNYREEYAAYSWETKK
jgi:hypothetical protein